MKTNQIYVIITVIGLLLFSHFTINAQVSVTGASVSSNGDYTTLKDAFDAINTQIQTGLNIVVKIHESTTEAASAVLNAGAWTTLIIYPTDDNVSVSGDLSGSSIITLWGADRVTIDGRVNAAGSTASLTIENTSTSTSASANTIRFRDGSENNTLKYATFKGSLRHNEGGIIHFDWGAGGIGNRNNIIEYCNITNSGENRPYNGIFSKGAGSGNLANSNNIIRHNNFYNLSNPEITTRYLHVSQHSPTWTITGNSFYETSTLHLTVTTSGSLKRDYMIYIAPSPNAPPLGEITNTVNAFSSQGAIIENNYFGGSEPLCAGIAYTVVGAPSKYNYRAIFVNAGTEENTIIENNVIRNIKISAINSNQTGDFIQAFNGITAYRSKAIIRNNTIGDMDNTSSIFISADATSTSQEWMTTGISFELITETNLVISGNRIGGIDALNTILNGRHDFFGIYSTGTLGNQNAEIEISGNIIGGRNAQSIQSPVNTQTPNTSSTNIAGIHLRSPAKYTIEKNIVRNIRHFGTATGNLYGIYSSAPSEHFIDGNEVHDLVSTQIANNPLQGITIKGQTTALELKNNKVHNLKNITTSTSATGIVGIWVETPATNTHAKIHNNYIHSLSVPNNNPMPTSLVSGTRLWGIYLDNSQIDLSRVLDVYNNVIVLGRNENKRISIIGIGQYGSWGITNKIRFNTVYIGGTPLGQGNSPTTCLYVSNNNSHREISNNVLFNGRSGASNHFSVYFEGTANTTVNYNNYFANGAGAILAYWNGNKNNLSELQATNNQDQNSFSVNPQFVNIVGDNAPSFRTTQPMQGVFLSDITNDFNGTMRIDPPQIGAFELNSLANYSVVTNPNPQIAGITTGDGTYTENTEVTVTAEQNEGYIFANWTENNQIVSTNSAYTFQIQSDRNLQANFIDLSEQYTIITNSNPQNAGNTTGDGTYTTGSQVTVSAQANEGYVFVNWTENNQIISTDNIYTFQILSNRNLQANFSSDASIAEFEKQIVLYPNPTNDFICVKMQSEIGNTLIYIMDVVGRVVIHKEIYVSEETVCTDVSNLDNGMYVLMIKNNIGTISQKFFLNKH